MDIEDITKLIAKHGSVTAEPLRDLIVTVVLEAVEAEREACAKVCEDTDVVEFGAWHHDGRATLSKAADAIRARSDK
jgi:class 3 adenylate cyclase